MTVKDRNIAFKVTNEGDKPGLGDILENLRRALQEEE